MQVSPEFVAAVRKSKEIFDSTLEQIEQHHSSLEQSLDEDDFESEVTIDRRTLQINRVKYYMNSMQDPGFFEKYDAAATEASSSSTVRTMSRRYSLCVHLTTIGFYLVAWLIDEVEKITQVDLECIEFDIETYTNNFGSPCLAFIVPVRRNMMPHHISKVGKRGLSTDVIFTDFICQDTSFYTESIQEFTHNAITAYFEKLFVSVVDDIFSDIGDTTTDMTVWSAILEAVHGLRVGSTCNLNICSFEVKAGEPAEDMHRRFVQFVGDKEEDIFHVLTKTDSVVASPPLQDFPGKPVKGGLTMSSIRDAFLFVTDHLHILLSEGSVDSIIAHA